jgi:single-strand DNA-binding protein
MLKIQLIGRLGQDSIVNDVNGKKVVNFSVAHTEKYKNNQGGEVNKTTWVSCAYWTDKLNIANYLKKGTSVYVEGKPEVKTYTDKNSGNILPQLSMRVSSIQLLSSQNSNNEEKPNNIDLIEQTDDMPF